MEKGKINNLFLGEFHSQHKSLNRNLDYSFVLKKEEIQSVLIYLKSVGLWEFIYEGNITINSKVGRHIETEILKKDMFNFNSHEISFGFYIKPEMFNFLINVNNEIGFLYTYVIPEALYNYLSKELNLKTLNNKPLNRGFIQKIQQYCQKKNIWIIPFDINQNEYIIQELNPNNYLFNKDELFN